MYRCSRIGIERLRRSRNDSKASSVATEERFEVLFPGRSAGDSDAEEKRIARKEKTHEEARFNKYDHANEQYSASVDKALDVIKGVKQVLNGFDHAPSDARKFQAVSRVNIRLPTR